jgi:hypothetical protein
MKGQSKLNTLRICSVTMRGAMTGRIVEKRPGLVFVKFSIGIWLHESV